MKAVNFLTLALLSASLASPLWAAGPGSGSGFTQLDADGDGRLSAEEMSALPLRGGRSPEDRFARLDTDADGYLTPDEMQQARQRMREHRPKFSELDTDGDGQLSLDEMGSLPPRGPGTINDRFARLDQDNNGYVSPDELRAAARQRHQARHQVAPDQP